ncbi:MAG: TatD family hydrolase [Treponema sp.]|nr:TatD family hydrolase [Treponema sp.]
MDFFDAHFHAVQCLDRPGCTLEGGSGCSCALSPSEFEFMEDMFRDKAGIRLSFGIHPLTPDESLIPYLEGLLRDGRISAVGEIGFDFFNAEGRASKAVQEKVWTSSLDLARSYGYPVIIHNRKAMDMMYLYSGELSRVPAVMFHSFPFGFREAKGILDRGINGFFSFGKTLLRGSVRNAECIRNLPDDRILFETDAPFQKLGGEPFTSPTDIASVYDAASRLKGIETDRLSEKVMKNAASFFASGPAC